MHKRRTIIVPILEIIRSPRFWSGYCCMLFLAHLTSLRYLCLASLLETAHVALLSQAAYFVFVYCKLPENNIKALSVASGFAVSVTITAIITIIVQSFYAWRVYTLSIWRQVKYPVVAFILATSFAEFCLGLATNALLFGKPPVDSTRGKLQRRLYSATLISTITCDLTISVALVYFLSQMRSSLRSTRNVINRLILFSINVGLLTSAIALCTLVSYYVTPPTSIFFSVFVAINGKFYVNSMLVTLNSRKSAREIFDRPESIPLTNLTTSQSKSTGAVSFSIPRTLPTVVLEDRPRP